MNNNEVIYIAANCEPFKIRQIYKPLVGVFFFVRLVWSVQAEGGSLLQRSLFCLFFTFTLIAPAFVLDCVLLVGYAVFKLTVWLFKQVGAMIKDIIKIIITNYLGTFLKFAAILTFILILMNKWHEIKDLSKEILQAFF